MNLIVPMYSMRSYKTGKYSLLKDGNLQLHLNRHQKGDVIVIPHSLQCEDSEELQEYFPDIIFEEAVYQENAYKSRKTFWEYNTFMVDSLANFYNCDAVVSDITGYKGAFPVFFNFNITKDPKHPREYIDEFIQEDVDSVNRSIYTTVLNKCQKDVLVSHGALSDKIIVTQEVITPGVPEKFMQQSCIDFDWKNTIFFPFRISDKCYDFDYVYHTCKMYDLKLVITDPNDSWDKEKYPDCELLKLNKSEYYHALKAKPNIIYEENPEKVFHPGLAEFIYFKCNVQCIYALPTYEDIIVKGPIWEI